MKLSVVIPVYNEKSTVEEIIRRVQAVDVGLEKEIVVVDDFSTDGTRDILGRLSSENVRVVLHEKNTGKGGAPTGVCRTCARSRYREF